MTDQTATSFPTDAQTLLTGFLRLADVMAGVIAAYLAFWWRNDTLYLPYYYLEAVALGALISFNYLHIAGVYANPLKSSATLQLFRATAAWGGVLLTLVTLAYFTEISSWFSQAWAGLWFGLTVIGIILVRLVAIWQRQRWQEQGDLSIRIAVVGAGDLGHAVIRQLNQTRRNDIELVGVFDDFAPLPLEVEGCPVKGTVDDLIQLTRRTRIDEIVLAMVDRSEDEVERVLAKLRPVPINTKLCAHSVRFNMPVGGFTSFAGLPLLHVYDRPLRGWGGFWKKFEDRLLGAMLFLLTMPVMALIALAVRIDSPGPVLFRQKRYGFNNNEITVYKFRTMFDDPTPDNAIPQAQRNDKRVTRIGAILRRTSLDELPQMINVLRGEMSLVGPRPHAVAHNEQYAKIIDGYLGRHRVKPGITGWAQINGLRGETDTPEKMRMRVQYDLFYIDHWSLIFDLKILAKTTLVGFINQNAY